MESSEVVEGSEVVVEGSEVVEGSKGSEGSKAVALPFFSLSVFVSNTRVVATTDR